MNTANTQTAETRLNLARIAVIGCPGSGKTTLSNALGGILRRPVVHLDSVLWQPNWVLPSYEVRQQIHAQIIAEESWIVDGMWSSHVEERISRATLVVFLDFGKHRCFARVLNRRRKYRGKQRPDLAQGCLEKHDKEFLRYVWTFGKQKRPQLMQMLSNAQGAQVVTLKNPKQVNAFLRMLQR